ncbi:Probable diguanylate cyclase YcdT [Delftia tsuruhatensis]|nr:Probable diguanylate cyclase YcdT [Delftia tsuruhatensis]CAC9685289.1 Probable diguanylate cyclase YcdT [Delftia tsuruhatensis]
MAFLASAMALALRSPGQMSSLWLTNALLLGWMLRNPAYSQRHCWITAAMALTLAEWLSGSTFGQALWLTFVDLSAVACGWLMMRRLPLRVQQMRSPSSVLHLVMCSLTASIVGAVLGALGMHHLQNWPWQPVMALWFSSELMHMTLLLPVLLSFPAGPELMSWRGQPLRHTLQALLPLVALAASEAIAIYLGGPGALSLTMPAMLLCAMRYRLFVVALLNLASCAIKLAAFSDTLLGTPGISLETTFSFRLGLAMLSIGPLAVACTLKAFKDMLNKLRHAVNHDALTGLLARASFMDRAQRTLERLHREHQPGAMLMLDLDHFKCINDHYGHAAGDRVLQEISCRLAQALRPHELIGRLGGEEFAVLLPGADRATACAVAQRLCEAARAIRIDMGQECPIRPTLSIGIGFTHMIPSAPCLSTLLRQADTALYQAKATGRDRYCVAGDRPQEPLLLAAEHPKAA